MHVQALPLRAVVPYMKYGALGSLLRDTHKVQPEFLDLQQRMLFCMDIANGMAFLANHGLYTLVSAYIRLFLSISVCGCHLSAASLSAYVRRRHPS